MRSSNFKLFFPVVFLLLFNFLFSENEITSFLGGDHSFRISLSTNLFTGTDAKRSSYGNSNSSLIRNPSAISQNPATLGFINTTQVQFEMLPGIMGKINNMYSGFQEEINNAVDKGIQDMKSSKLEPVYPQVDVLSGQAFQINNLSFLMSFPKIGTFGFAYNNIFSFSMDGTVNGFSVKTSDISQIQENGNVHEEKTIIPLSMEALINMDINYKQFNLAWGRSLVENQLSLGLGLNILSATIQADQETLIDGIIRQTGGTSDITAAFNDPSDDFRNSLDINLHTNFSRRLVRPRLAVSYNPNKKIYLDLTYLPSGTMNLKGELNIIQHKLGALNIDYDEAAGEELFDLNQLKPSQITYTNQVNYYSDHLHTTYPGKIAFSAAYQKNWFKSIISYEKSLGEFSFHYKCDIFKNGQKKMENTFIYFADTSSREYKLIHRPSHTIKVGIGLGFFSIGGQVVLGDILFEGFKDDKGQPKENITGTLIGGSIATNLSFDITKNMHIDVGLFSLPASFFRTNIIYKL